MMGVTTIEVTILNLHPPKSFFCFFTVFILFHSQMTTLYVYLAE